MASDGTFAPNRLNDIADTLQACERENVCGRTLPHTAVPLLAEAERLGAFSGPEYAAVRLALARWRNRGTDPWDEVIGQKVESDPSVITYQRIVSAIFPDLADTDEEESEFKIPGVGAGENTDARAVETVRLRHRVGKCELHLWVNWAAAAPRIADIIRLVPEEPTAKTEQGDSQRLPPACRWLLETLEQVYPGTVPVDALPERLQEAVPWCRQKGLVSWSFGYVMLSPNGRDRLVEDRLYDPATEGGNNDSDVDRKFMERAVEEARKSRTEDGRVHPKVGVVIVKEGRELATAYRGEFGKGEHAEFTALERKLADQTIAGATIYTTLEPCTTRNHPKVPCADRLIERKVSRVVIGMLDPNPDIHGSGLLTLRKASIAITLFDEDLMSVIEEMNRDFIRQHKGVQRAGSHPFRGRPGPAETTLPTFVSSHEPPRSTQGETAATEVGETQRLQREARAASRCSPENMALFEQKLNEIDLLDNVAPCHKVAAFQELGQEVALNSDRGTCLLVEHILWQVAGWDRASTTREIMEIAAARSVVALVASALWEIGINGVEYGRSRETVETLTRAILEVHQKARLIGAEEALDSCRGALDSMLSRARSDKRADVIGLVEQAVRNLDGEPLPPN